MSSQARAILWAQWCAVRNFFPRASRFGVVISLIVSAVWYTLWTIGAAAVALLISESRDPRTLQPIVGPALMLTFLYWQVIPVLMATAGASLDVRRLRVYPIPSGELFFLEVLLRLSTAIEMLFIVAGAAAGVALNPELRPWHALALLPFLAFNLLVSAGIRDFLTRLINRRATRELALLVMLAVAVLPRWLLQSQDPGRWKVAVQWMPAAAWPWSVTARLLLGDWTGILWAGLFAWTAAAFCFGWWQFRRGLRFDEEAARAAGGKGRSRSSLVDRIFSLPSLFLPDPIGVMVEKEFRSLVRSPRFRVVFIMGFTFGLLVWLPASFGRGRGGWMERHLLLWLLGYSMMLMSEVTIWNVLGFDRKAAQMYWLSPVKVTHVLISKNISAVLFFLLEAAMIIATCLMLGLELGLKTIFEALLICVISMLFLASIGNLSSLYNPRPVDANQTWRRGTTSRTQMLLIFVYPVLIAPFAFAFWARSVWETDAAFYAVVGAMAILGAGCYGLCLEKAAAVAGERKEAILSTLAEGDGPVIA